MSPQDALRRHWPEYAMEAAGLGLFMVSAGLVTTALEHPASPLHQAIADPLLRRALIGLAMGATAVALIYSPWGQQSGAHLNPAVTLAFWRLGKLASWDAVFYMLAQCAGGLAGTLLVAAVLADRFTARPILAVATVPSSAGVAAAWIAEAAISFGLMLTVLLTADSARLMRLTGLFAGLLVALYIGVEAPVSGMSMNPARSLASAVPSGLATGLWIYFTAPPLGMLAAAELYRALRAGPRACAKLNHHTTRRCIFCGFGMTEPRTEALRPKCESLAGSVS